MAGPFALRPVLHVVMSTTHGSVGPHWFGALVQLSGSSKQYAPPPLGAEWAGASAGHVHVYVSVERLVPPAVPVEQVVTSITHDVAACSPLHVLGPASHAACEL